MHFVDVQTSFDSLNDVKVQLGVLTNLTTNITTILNDIKANITAECAANSIPSSSCPDDLAVGPDFSMVSKVWCTVLH